MADSEREDEPRGFYRWWPILALALIVVILAAGNLLFRHFESEDRSVATVAIDDHTINSPSRVRAYDGDTIILSVRLIGFDTPENRKGHADCDGELQLGKKAKARLQELIDSGHLKLEYVQCSCREGTYGTEDCNFGRPCAILHSHGRNVADILIAERLAVPYHCQATNCPPQPFWCAP